MTTATTSPKRIRCKCGTVFQGRTQRLCRQCATRRTREHLLDQLRTFTATHGRSPTAVECGAGRPSDGPTTKRDRSLADYKTYCYHFRSFRKALEAAGIEPRPSGRHVTRRSADTKAAATPRRRARYIEPEMRADFQLYKAEMMMELERQCSYDGTIQVGEGRRIA